MKKLESENSREKKERERGTKQQVFYSAWSEGVCWVAGAPATQ